MNTRLKNQIKTQKKAQTTALGHLRRHWLLTVVATLVVAISTLSVPAWAGPVAAPLNQTVPPATPTPPFNQEVPTATPLPLDAPEDTDENDNDDDDASSGGSTGNGVGDGAGDDGEEIDPNSVPFQMPESTGESAETTVAQAGDELTANVSVGTLNVREGPGTGFPVIGTFSLNQVVTLEARNPENSWWYVCCLPNTETRGWVSAPLLQTNFDREQSAQLIPVFGQEDGKGDAEAAPAPTATPRPVAATIPMSFTLGHTPNYVWQGKTFDIQFTIANPNDAALRNLEVSDELPAGLLFVEAAGEGAPTITNRTTDAGGVLVRIRWSTIPADAIVNGKITVRVDPTLPDGAVLDNLAAARATNGEYTTAGFTLGLPPAAIPDFQ